MLEGEPSHLGYEKHDPAGKGSGNSRNGKSKKTLKGGAGEIAIEVPRDREGTFEPKIAVKHQTRFDGFDGKIRSMYARGMTVRDIKPSSGNVSSGGQRGLDLECHRDLGSEPASSRTLDIERPSSVLRRFNI